MAEMTVRVGEDPQSEIVASIDYVEDNSCKTIWLINVNNTIGDELNVSVSNVVGTYAILGFSSNFIEATDYTTTIEESIKVTIENSGITDQFNSVDLTITNNTTGGTITFVLTRFNDGTIC